MGVNRVYSPMSFHQIPNLLLHLKVELWGESWHLKVLGSFLTLNLVFKDTTEEILMDVRELHRDVSEE